MSIFCRQSYQAILCHSGQAFAQVDSIKTYLLDALSIMQKKSVNKGKVDWAALRADALSKTADAKTIKVTYPVIKNALGALKDSHSNFYPPEMVKAYTLGYHATGQVFPVIKIEMKENGYAYISLPDIGSFNNADWDEYVNDFYHKVFLLQKQKPKGWIIDLRENFGGMLYPMYAAIAPFLDSRNVVGIKDAQGAVEYFNYKHGKFYERAKPTQYFTIKGKRPTKIKDPVVVMISKKTGSSGEFITAGFVGQKNAALVGENTQGLTSGNQEYKLADGAFIALTVGNIVDRKGKEYAKIGEGIPPNIRVEKSANKEKTNEAYLSAAFRYIDKR